SAGWAAPSPTERGRPPWMTKAPPPGPPPAVSGAPGRGMINFFDTGGHLILLAFLMNLKLFALSCAGSLGLCTGLGAMRVAPLSVLRAVGTLYVNILRNTPLTLVLLFCGLGLGSIITIANLQTTNYFWLAVIGLVTYTSAFVCEVLRSGVNTVP